MAKIITQTILAIILVVTMFSFVSAGECPFGDCPTNITVVIPYYVTPPIVTVYSPIPSESYTVTDDKKILFNFSATPNITSMWYSMDSGSNVNYTGALLVQHPSIGPHTTTFCASNSAGTSCQVVSYILQTPSGQTGGGGGGGGSTILPGQNITFSTMIINYGTWKWDSTSYVEVITQDINGLPVDVDSVVVTVLTPMQYNPIPVYKRALGDYIASFTSSAQNISAVDLRITVTQGSNTQTQDIKMQTSYASGLLQMSAFADKMNIGDERTYIWLENNGIKILIGFVIVLGLGLTTLMINLLSKEK